MNFLTKLTDESEVVVCLHEWCNTVLYTHRLSRCLEAGTLNREPRKVTGDGETMRTFILMISALSVIGLHAEAQAVPPTQVRGIDLNAVLAMYDHSRAASILESDEPRQTFKAIKTIVIDPGHGGDNHGAVGVAEVHEKYLTIELAFALRDRLQRAYPDVRIVMTRYWDQEVGLSDRIAYANRVGADVFLSLHYNAAVHNRAVGFETYYLSTEEVTPGMQERKGAPIATAAPGVTGMAQPDESKPRAGAYNDTVSRLQRDLERQTQHRRSSTLARVVNASLAAKLDTINRGVKQANFAVLRGALMPAVVVEAGFVSHPDEGQKLLTKEHRFSIVEALVQSVVEFDDALSRDR